MTATRPTAATGCAGGLGSAGAGGKEPAGTALSEMFVRYHAALSFPAVLAIRIEYGHF